MSPFLENLEGDPRHSTFLKKMNLPVDWAGARQIALLLA